MSFEELASRLSGKHTSEVALAFSRARANSSHPYEFEVAITRGSKPRPPQPQQPMLVPQQLAPPPPRASPVLSPVKQPHQV